MPESPRPMEVSPPGVVPEVGPTPEVGGSTTRGRVALRCRARGRGAFAGVASGGADRWVVSRRWLKRCLTPVVEKLPVVEEER